MQLNFNRINFDNLDDADEDELREIVEDYEEAQESNAAEFEAAKERIDEIDDVDVEEFQSAREELVEEITDYDEFEDSPVTTDQLEEASFGQLREWDEYFAPSSDESEEGDFEDFGNEAPVDPDGDDDAEFAEQHLGNIPGVNF